ncbi:MAG TPA: lectin-like protein [Phycisphaerales bacterium]
MRFVLSAVIGCVLAVGSAADAAITVEAGPVFNPATGSRYYRIAGGDWNQLRAFAVAMGGDLASVDDAAENTWIRANIVGNGGKPYIGLNDAGVEGTLVWSDGSTSAYRMWRVGEPTNTATKDYVRFDGQAGGTWEIVTADFGPQGIVEIKPTASGPPPVRVPSEQPTIEAAVAAVGTSGSTQVLIAPGTYTLAGQVELNGCTLRGSGMDQTVVEGITALQASVSVLDGRIEDLTLVNRSADATVRLWSGSLVLRGVRFTSQLSTAGGVLYAINAWPSSTLIDGCQFDTSDAAISHFGGTVRVVNTVFRDLGRITVNPGSTASPVFTASNCTFVRCGPSPLFPSGVNHSISNSIFYKADKFDSGTYTITNSLVDSVAGATNISGNPLFVDEQANDFRLLPGSPCIDRGDVRSLVAAGPDDWTDFAGQERSIDTPGAPNFHLRAPIDLGAFEFAPPACPGDLNGDGVVDDVDFQIFVVWYNQVICP